MRVAAARSPRGQHHAPTTSADGQQPGPVKPSAAIFHRFDHRLGVPEAIQRDHGLVRIGQERCGHDFRAGQRAEAGHQRLQVCQRICVVAQRNLEKPEAMTA
jgi:hypothetical protein